MNLNNLRTTPTAPNLYGELANALQEQHQRDWPHIARPNQLPPPGNWTVWLLLAGRGWGKSRTGAEWVRQRVETGLAHRIALVAPTAADARQVMVEGESGLLAISPSWNRPQYEPSRRQITWPNGAIATLFSADEPDRMRGPQFDTAWCDELAAWRFAEDGWNTLMLALRLGRDPRCCVTTTPKPIHVIRDLLARAGKDVTVTRGRTIENRANLAPSFFSQIISQYQGTRLGRQEIEGELLEDVPGALWQRQTLDDLRLTEAPDLHRIVVAIDPAASSDEDSDETGIVVAGIDRQRDAYVLEDLSGRYQPTAWARRAIDAFRRHDADRIVAEVNNGGDMVEAVLRQIDPKVSFKAVHASRGKAIRAEPVSALYEKASVHHIGTHAALEDQMCSFCPDDPRRRGNSPDRVDALVWALSDLVINRQGSPFILPRATLSQVATMPQRNRFGERRSRFPIRDRFARWNR
jgi:predicted phage terminase large subunit-like protein